MAALAVDKNKMHNTTWLRAEIPDIHGKFGNHVHSKPQKPRYAVATFSGARAKRASPSVALLAWLSHDFHGILKRVVSSTNYVCHEQRKSWKPAAKIIDDTLVPLIL